MSVKSVTFENRQQGLKINVTFAWLGDGGGGGVRFWPNFYVATLF